MRLQFLVTPDSAPGAPCLPETLKEDLLVFVYQHIAPRTFHTYLCPRCASLHLSADGQALFGSGHFRLALCEITRLPDCH